MPKYIEKAERMHLPALAMRGLIAFPAIPLTFEVADEADAGVCLEAEKNDGVIFIVSLRDLSLTGTTEENLYSVGTVVKIKQTVKLPEGNLKVFAAGICRATAENLTIDDSIITADVIGKDLRLADKNSVKAEALVAEMRNTFDSFSKLMPKPSNELVTAIKSLSDPGLLADFIAGSVLMNYVDKQMVLEEFDPMRRAELVCLLMERESDILRTEMNIHKKVRAQLDANQRDYYLKEQLRAIRDELGENEEEEDEEIVEYNSKIAAANLPDEVREKLVKEVKKLAKTPYTSAESSVMRNYLDLCLELPWGVKSNDRIDVAAAQKILE